LPSCTSHQSASCYENYAIPPNLSGQTLRALDFADRSKCAALEPAPLRRSRLRNGSTKLAVVLNYLSRQICWRLHSDLSSRCSQSRLHVAELGRPIEDKERERLTSGGP
jgi:hypothetical protein